MPQIDDQMINEDAAWSFQVPTAAFVDFPGDLDFTATLADGSPLPGWLAFDAETRTFSGTPPQDFNGVLSFRVTANDGVGTAFADFDLEVAAVDDAPTVGFDPLYSSDFEGGSNWVYYDPDGVSQIPVPVESDGGNSYLSSEGPWWFDPNHTTPGAGFLHLLAIGYAQSVNQEMSLTSLVGTQISFDIRTEDLQLPDGAHIRFWFQAVDSKLPGSAQTVNYALDVEIEDMLVDGEWTRITLDLSEDDADWIPLFSNPTRTDTYNRSATIRDALEGRLLDSGFIILMGDEQPNPPATGTVMIDNIAYEHAATPEVRYEAAGALQSLGLNASYDDVDSDTVGLSISLTVTGDPGEGGVVSLLLPNGSSLDWTAGGLWQGGVRIADVTLAGDARGLTIDFLESVSAATVDEVLAALAYATSEDDYGRDSLSLVLTDDSGAALTSDINIWRPYPAPPSTTDFTINGTADRDWLHGADGDDTLTGLASDDYLDGHAGADTMTGGQGNDWYFIDDAGDVVVEAAGEGTQDRIFTTLSYRLPTGVEVDVLTTIFAGATTAINLAGNEFANLIYGNAGTNVLEGGGGNDTIVALEGADTVYGGSGFDQLDGGSGNDILDGGADADILRGGTGDDWYFVDHVGDIIVDAAGAGADRLFASASYALASNAEIEILSTNNHAGTAAIDLFGSNFANRIQGNEGANRLDGFGGDDILVGAGGDDFLSGGLGGDNLQGGAGFDQLDGGAGADTLEGGQGDDWYFVDNANDVIVETTGSGTTDRIFASASYRMAAGVAVEILSTALTTGTTAINLAGNAYANLIYGNDGANLLEGLAGADSLIGLGGDDRLDGGAGADYLYGGLGNDTYYVDNALDVIEDHAGEGTDRVYASVNYQLGFGVEIETLTTSDHAGTGAINLYGNEFANKIQGNEGAIRLDGGGGADLLVGSGGEDRLNGGDAADTLQGGTGGDTLDGGAGVDFMLGGTGDDFYYVDEAADRIEERAGEGFDRVYASASYQLAATAAEIELLATTNAAGTTAINLTGNGGANTIYGNDGVNTLSGAGGDDSLLGGGGDDVLIGGAGKDSLTGGAGADVLYGDTAASSGSEAGIFQGGTGDDTAWGGSGADLYRFARGDGHDVVHDTGGVDALEILGALTPADIIFEIVGGDLFIGLRDPSNPDAAASAVADSIRVVGGGVQGATIERVLVGGQSIVVTGLGLPWAAASGAVLAFAGKDAGPQTLPDLIDALADDAPQPSWLHQLDHPLTGDTQLTAPEHITVPLHSDWP